MAGSPEFQPPGIPVNNPAAPTVGAPTTTENAGPTLAPKRQRRPSVRLGDIGDQPTTVRTSKSWRLNPHREPNPNPNPNPNKFSKIRPLTNLVSTNGNLNPNEYSSAETNTNTNANTATTSNNNGNSHRKLPKELKHRRTTMGAKRVRTNLTMEDEEEEEENAAAINDNDEEENPNDDEEGFRDFDPEGSPIQSADNVELLDVWHGHNRRSIRATGGGGGGPRVSDSHHDLGLDGFPESDSRNRPSQGLDDGVRKWLFELGLGRYAPVFEIHEVDDEVLPYLTLEDLKDMGINAVGSRRKLFSAIQKLRKGLS